MGKKTAGAWQIKKAAGLARPKSMLLFGQPKRGKTSLAASLVKVKGYKKVLLIDIDLGSSAIAQDYPDIDVVEFKRGDIAAFEKFWAQLVAEDGMGYDAVILDTLSILQDWKIVSIPKSDGYAKWDAVKEFTLQLMWDLHEMTPTGVATLHTKVQNVMKGAEDDDAFVKLNPSLVGSAGVHIGAIPDLIGFCDVREADEDDEEDDIVYFVQLKPSEQTNTGNRFKGLPDRLEDPSMARIFELIATNGKKD